MMTILSHNTMTVSSQDDISHPQRSPYKVGEKWGENKVTYTINHCYSPTATAAEETEKWKHNNQIHHFLILY